MTAKSPDDANRERKQSQMQKDSKSQSILNKKNQSKQPLKELKEDKKNMTDES